MPLFKIRRLSEGGVYYKLQLMAAAFIRGRRLLEELWYSKFTPHTEMSNELSMPRFTIIMMMMMMIYHNDNNNDNDEDDDDDNKFFF